MGHSSNPTFWEPPQYAMPLHNYLFLSMSEKTPKFQEVKSLSPSKSERCDLSPGPTEAPEGWLEGRHTQCLFACAWEVGLLVSPSPLPRGPHGVSTSRPPALPRGTLLGTRACRLARAHTHGHSGSGLWALTRFVSTVDFIPRRIANLLVKGKRRGSVLFQSHKALRTFT